MPTISDFFSNDDLWALAATLPARELVRRIRPVVSTDLRSVEVQDWLSHLADLILDKQGPLAVAEFWQELSKIR